MLQAQRTRALEAYRRFLDTPLDAVLRRCLQRSPAEAAVALAREVAASVPAYAAFLRAHGLDPAAIDGIGAFERLPFTTKSDYVLRHPLAALCRDGRLESCDMIAVSSGSTGRPTFWPRFLADELAVAERFEQVFVDGFDAARRRTLAVVCFSLGTWVGGMYSAGCCRHLAAKGYPITVVTPGNHHEEILRVVGELGAQFDQVVLLGYPPFVKDVIDTGIARGIDWRAWRMRLVFAGEVFSEEWRSLVAERAGCSDPRRDTATLYGTADAGVLGNETPLSVTIRRFLAGEPQAARGLFGESRLPTLVQYDPCRRYFETSDGTLLFTGDNGVPLVRYHIADSGGLIAYRDMLAFLAARGFDPLPELAAAGLAVRELPFVYVFGRADFTVSYFGANVYPENITVGLEQPGIREWVTGKFVLQVSEDADRNRHLAVAVELAPGETAGAERTARVTASILAQLLRLNSEYGSYVPEAYRTPRVSLIGAGDPHYFPPGVKHRYTRRGTSPEISPAGQRLAGK